MVLLHSYLWQLEVAEVTFRKLEFRQNFEAISRPALTWVWAQEDQQWKTSINIPFTNNQHLHQREIPFLWIAVLIIFTHCSMRRLNEKGLQFPCKRGLSAPNSLQIGLYKILLDLRVGQRCFESRKCKSPNLSKKNENLKSFLFSEIFQWDRRCRKVEWCFQSLFADKRVFEIWLRHHKMTFQSLPQISNWAQQHKILYTIKNVVGFLSFASNAGLNMLLLGLKFFWWLSDGLRNCMQ